MEKEKNWTKLGGDKRQNISKEKAVKEAAYETELGLERSIFEDNFCRLPTDIQFHLDQKDWIMVFLEKRFDIFKDNFLTQNLSEDLLDKIGFKLGSKGMKIILQRSKLFHPNHQSPLDAVKRFVVDEFKYNSHLSDGSNQKNTGQHLSSISFSVASAIDAQNETVIWENPEQAIEVHNHIQDLSRQEPNDILLYHGTDKHSAHHIELGGVALNLGWKKRDFSHGRGFYLTNNFEHAKKWALSITQAPAVLIFIIPKSLLTSAQPLNLSEESNPEKWTTIVNANRIGRVDWRMREELKQCDYIEGPVSVTTGGSCGTDNEMPIVNRQPISNSYQLCIINNDFADKISKCLNTIVTYTYISTS